MMVRIEIEKSPVPIVWLDTSVITKMTMYRTKPEKLEEAQKKPIARLYELVRSGSRNGKIICPLADQEMEIWIGREEWLDTIHDLGLGIECAAEQTIQDKQMSAAIRSYVSGSDKVCLGYLDAFLDDPVEELKRNLGKPFFITVNRGVLFGADYQRSKNQTTLALLNKAREDNVRNRVPLEKQIEVEKVGELQMLIAQAAKFEKGIGQHSPDEDSIWSYLRLQRVISNWVSLGGMPADLIGYIKFYNSEYNAKCPYNELRTMLYAKIMVDPQPIRSGDAMDIQHISTMMPYADLFITDKAWSTFLNRSGISERYRTKVGYIGDTDMISEFLEPLC